MKLSSILSTVGLLALAWFFGLHKLFEWQEITTWKGWDSWVYSAESIASYSGDRLRQIREGRPSAPPLPEEKDSPGVTEEFRKSPACKESPLKFGNCAEGSYLADQPWMQSGCNLRTYNRLRRLSRREYEEHLAAVQTGVESPLLQKNWLRFCQLKEGGDYAGWVFIPDWLDAYRLIIFPNGNPDQIEVMGRTAQQRQRSQGAK